MGSNLKHSPNKSFQLFILHKINVKGHKKLMIIKNTNNTKVIKKAISKACLSTFSSRADNLALSYKYTLHERDIATNH
jgi:hypothetical protein